jgi:hypothetical protein
MWRARFTVDPRGRRTFCSTCLSPEAEHEAGAAISSWLAQPAGGLVEPGERACRNRLRGGSLLSRGFQGKVSESSRSRKFAERAIEGKPAR